MGHHDTAAIPAFRKIEGGEMEVGPAPAGRAFGFTGSWDGHEKNSKIKTQNLLYLYVSELARATLAAKENSYRRILTTSRQETSDLWQLKWEEPKQD